MTDFNDAQMGEDAARPNAAQQPSDVTRQPISIQYSIFDELSAQKVKPVHETWQDLVAMLTNPPEHARKKHCPLLKLAGFGSNRTANGSLRHDDNMVEIYGVEGDYDDEEVSIEQAAAMLEQAGIEAFFYTSASHGVTNPPHSNGGPRWRVIAPLSQPYPSAERRRLVAMLNFALGGILAKESFTSSQPFYFGKVLGVEYETRQVTGQPLDKLAHTLQEEYPAGLAGRATPLPPKDGVREFERDMLLQRVNDETIAELRSALSVNPATNKPWIDPDSRVTWVAVANNLKCLGEVGYGLWLTWSAHSTKFNDGGNDPLTVWNGCPGDRADFRAVFIKAAAGGWVNPKSAEALKANATAATRIDRTDAGNVAVLASLTGGDLRYVPERRLWLCWTGQRWEPDTYGSGAQAAALQVAEYYYQKAADLRRQMASSVLDAKGSKHVDQAADNLDKWASICRNKRYLDSMLNLAKADARFTLPAEELDKDPWLLGVENGVVDLHVGTLREASRDEFVTRRSPIAFDPAAAAPRWERFIGEITAGTLPDGKQGGRPELAAYLQRALGYCLTGETREHKMFIAIGGGSNGKSVLLDTLKPVMGDYCESIPPEALMATRYDADAERATPVARRLAGARMAISSESKDGQRLDVALVKRHTGGGFLTARGLHEGAFTFEISHKLWLMTNHKPALDHMDDAMRGRLHLIPFDMRFNRPGHPEQDPNLPAGDKTLSEKLKAEAVGILAWLVAGAVAYVKHGLEPPTEVASMTRDFFKDQDSFQQWRDTCQPCEAQQGETASSLFRCYQLWCVAEGFGLDAAGNQTSFSNKLKALGIESHKTNTGNRYGLRAVAADATAGFDDIMA